MASPAPIFISPVQSSEDQSLERPPMLETMKYIRKPFNIDAVQVSGGNIQEIAKWVDGDIRTDDLGQYVKVRVHRPLNDRQTKAYIGDWVLYAGTGYKVYTPKAFANSFEQTSGESVMIDTSAPRYANKNTESEEVDNHESEEIENDEVQKVIENGVVVPKRIPKKVAKSAE